MPLISRLKATGRKVVGLGTEGTIANTLIQNCDEYIYYGSDGLRLQAKTLLDKTPVINALRKILGSRDCSLPALAEQLTRQLPDFSPAAYGNHDLEDFLRSIAPFVKLVPTGDGLRVQWVASRKAVGRQPSAQALEDYLRATRWFILDSATRDRLGDVPVVFLQVGLSDAVKRVGLGVGRPLLLGNVRSRIKALLDERTPVYESVATHVVDTDGRSADEVAATIRELIET